MWIKFLSPCFLCFVGGDRLEGIFVINFININEQEMTWICFVFFVYLECLVFVIRMTKMEQVIILNCWVSEGFILL